MILEIVGGLLLFAFGSIAIAEWFALQKLNARCENLESLNERMRKELMEFEDDLDW